VRQWRRNGIPIDDGDLGDLASSDGEALCEFGGVRFRFTAETIERHPRQAAPRRAAAVVLTLRQIGSPQGAAGGIHLVEFADPGLSDSSRCDARQCGQLADARAIADRTARRYVCAELFRKAQDIVAGDQAA
jgi:hypothetical protein